MGRNPNIKVDKGDTKHPTKEYLKGLKENTPIYKSQEFKKPEGLSYEESKVWEWLVVVFRDTTNCLVSDADVHLMELYCRAKVATDEANRELKKDPRAYIPIVVGVDKNGVAKTTAKANPNYKKRNENALLCLKFFDQLGLSPLARAKAGLRGAVKEKEENIFERLMRRTDD